MNLRRASSFSWPCFCLLVKSGKHISLQEAPVDAAAHWFGPAGSTPLYYVSQWEHHRKVSVTSIWHVQPEGSKTLSFCFSTFPDTAHYQRLLHNFARPPMECHTKCCREEMGGGELDMNTGKLASGSFGETALLYVLSYLKSHPSAASVGLC